MNFFKTNNSSQNLSHIDIYMELQVKYRFVCLNNNKNCFIFRFEDIYFVLLIAHFIK